MEIILILLGFTVPVFYIVGLVEVFGSIFPSKKGKKEPDQVSAGSAIENYLLSEVKKALEDGDVAKAKQLLSVSGKKIETEQSVPEVKVENAIDTEKIGSFFENWYSDNSINLLLYLGAFFIIVSAGTFVGFNWESFTGEVKANLISLMTFAFFGSGYLLYSFAPKVRRAGLTFAYPI